MAPSLKIIKDRKTFLKIRKEGRFVKGESFNLHYLNNKNLENDVFIGYIATKKLGNAVKRNKAKRLMRELAKKVLIKYSKKNRYYVLIAKISIFNKSFKYQENELKGLIS